MTATRVVYLLPAIVGLTVTGCHASATAGRIASSQPARQKTEVIEEYWPNGKLRLRHELLHQPDGTTVENGTYATWFDNGGRDYEGHYVNGRLEGLATRWHRNGVKESEQYYAHGLRNGPRYMWDENGLLRKEEHFVDDKPDGVWTTWDEEGQIKARQTYDKGVPKSQ
jgi:antitoxin component YwqK of YwqJK toxin-antitoxin module